MGAHDRAAKARARMEQVRREMAERRALRTRKARAATERAADSLRKQGPVAAQVAKHLGELGRRRAQAGGWATEKTERDRSYVMGFNGEDDEGKEQFTYRPAPPRAPVRPGGLGSIEDESPPESPPSTPPPSPTPPPQPSRPVTPPQPPRRPVRSREKIDDEDDFSNQSTWMHRQ
jgi:hypothetical protein